MASNVSIAFLADGRGFAYARVGGAESYVRRLAGAALTQGAKVEYILFNTGEDVSEEVSPGLTVRRLPDLASALRAIDNSDLTDVVTVLLSPPEELRYALFRRRRSKRLRFHKILFGGDVGGAKRLMLAMARGIRRYNGSTFVLTDRTMATLSGRGNYLLRPPVPDSFYATPADKSQSGPLKVIFVGRLDPEKGVDEVLELFDRLASRDDVDLTVHGYTWKGLRESEEIHERLVAQERIHYVAGSHEGYSPGAEQAIGEIFNRADVIVLPYKRFDRTIDPPLILLEAMASLCIPLTRPAGAVPEVVPAEWLCEGDDFVRWAEAKIGYLADNLVAARNAMAEWNEVNGVRASATAKTFLEAIGQECN